MRISFGARIQDDLQLGHAPSMLCINWNRTRDGAASTRFSVGDAQYDLVAVALFSDEHHTAYTRRGVTWSVYDDTREARRLSDDTRLQTALENARVFFYERRGTKRGHDV
jgi:ubiquitin C-terminal hydrolase